MRRVEFLRGFLAMFDSPTVRITKETFDVVEVHVSWPDDDEPQDIRWQATDTRLPDPQCLEIASYIASNDLLDIKDLTVPREKLYAQLARERNLSWSYEQFQSVFEDLLTVRIPMVYKGRETDAFFIHETKPPNAEEMRVLQRIRRRNIGTLVLFFLFLPAVILVSQVSTSTSKVFAFCYVGLLGILGGLTGSVKCPRCGEYFNMLDPWKLDNVLFEWIPRPFNHCQNCDLHL
ncbi:MAG: hypothetical protein ACE5IQ_03005 [Candidatus Methylomirabilales bacterium]